MEFKRKELAALTIAVLAVSTGLSAIGIFLSQTIWKFDAVILGAFLLGDYPLRWVLGLRKNKKVLSVINLLPRSKPPPSWARLALASCWFLVIVLVVGELAYFVTFFIGVIYAGKLLPSYVIVEFSLALSLWLSIDFGEHYRKELVDDRVHDFWANIVA